MASALGLCLFGTRSLLAQDTTPTTPPTTPPVVVDKGDIDLLRDLKGAPPEIKNLILNFDTVRDHYLAEQKALLLRLKSATAEQREKIREQLQDNREAFLAELKTFRQELRRDLQDLKDKISHKEFLRIIDAAHDAATDTRHKGRHAN